MRLPFPIAALALALTGCTGKIVVTKVPSAPSTKAPMDGVYYALPKTFIQVSQPIDRVELSAGKYVTYLPLFFPKIAESGDFVPADKVTFKLNKATFATAGEPDPDEIYFFKITEKGAVDRTALLEYTDQGTVSGASAQADNVTSDIILSVLSTAAGLAAKSFGAAGVAGFVVPTCVTADPNKTICTKIAGAPGSIDAIRLTNDYNRLKDYTKKLLDKAANDDPAGFDDALQAYSDIFVLKTARDSVRNSPSALAVDAQLKDFDAAIASALAYAFTGSQKKDTWSAAPELRPAAVTAMPEILKLNEQRGICFLNDLATGDQPPKIFWLEGAGYKCDQVAMLKVLNDRKAKIDPLDTDAIKAIDAKIARLPKSLTDARTLGATFVLDPANGQLFQQLDAAYQETGERGFYYRVPASTKIALKLCGERPSDAKPEDPKPCDTVTTGKLAIAQFGHTFSLPASTGGKTTAYALKFYEATGALKSFNVTSKTMLTKANADTLGSQATSLVTASKTANDEVTKLDREAKILADKAAIFNACKTLNQPCGGFVPPAAPPQQ